MQNQNIHIFKYYTALVIVAATCMLISQILAYRLIKIGPLIMPGGVIVFPLAYLIGDIITEIYGYKLAKQQVWLVTISLIIFGLVTNAILYFPIPHTHLHLEASYENIFRHSTRMSLGFIAGIFISDRINVYLLSKWKILLRGKYFWMRVIGANAISELFFSVVCGFIGYYHVIRFGVYVKLTFDVWLFKMLYISLIGYPLTYLICFLRRKEGITNNYNFNPFASVVG